jgi:hypothetical protein
MQVTVILYTSAPVRVCAHARVRAHVHASVCAYSFSYNFVCVCVESKLNVYIPNNEL